MRTWDAEQECIRAENEGPEEQRIEVLRERGKQAARLSQYPLEVRASWPTKGYLAAISQS